MHTYYFEKLQVWQNSKDFVLKVYSVTNTFPESEKFGIISQIRRASTSISANIAEGFSRNSDKEKLNSLISPMVQLSKCLIFLLSVKIFYFFLRKIIPNLESK